MKYYRIEDRLTTSGVSVYMLSYNVVKETAKGVWLELYGHNRFVLKESRKRFACPTKEEALESFKARKKRQIKILNKQLENAEMALNTFPWNWNFNEMNEDSFSFLND